MSLHGCCCGDDGGGGGNQYSNCQKVDCNEYRESYCFEVPNWKWAVIYIRYSQNSPFVGVSHYDAAGVPLPNQTPVWWFVHSGTFTIQGSVDLYGHDIRRNIDPVVGATDCVECGTFDVCPDGNPDYYSGPTGNCFSTIGGGTEYSWNPDGSDGMSESDLCDYDRCDPLRASVGYAGTSQLKYEVFADYRRGSSTAPIVPATVHTQSQTVDFPCQAIGDCLAIDNSAGIRIQIGSFPGNQTNPPGGTVPWCGVPDSLRTFAWTDSMLPPESSDADPWFQFPNQNIAAPGVSNDPSLPPRFLMSAFHAPFAGGSGLPIPVSCQCPSAKQRDWVGNWNGSIPTVPPATPAAADAAYPNELNSATSLFARVHAFNTPSIAFGECPL